MSWLYLYTQQEILHLIVENGRGSSANPGEFTLRAFINGKMDLNQAEAVADLIASENEGSHKLAMEQMKNGFSNDLKKLRDELLHFSSMIELELDFSQEDVEFADRKELENLLLRIQTVLKNLLDSFALGNVIKKGVPIAIVGPPNVGKSTLLNCLLNEDKAIISSIAGTTRDSIEDEITLDGINFRFIDTAGLRETGDIVEVFNKAIENAKKAKILLFLYDVTDADHEGISNQLKSILSFKKKTILIQNKMDISSDDKKIKTLIKDKFPQLAPPLLVITHKKESIDKLKHELIETVNKMGNDSQTIVTNVRHHSSLQSALKDIILVKKGMKNNISGDLLSVDLNSAIQSLGEITGEINTDDILGNVFQNFCIGK